MRSLSHQRLLQVEGQRILPTSFSGCPAGVVSWSPCQRSSWRTSSSRLRRSSSKTAKSSRTFCAQGDLRVSVRLVTTGLQGTLAHVGVLEVLSRLARKERERGGVVGGASEREQGAARHYTRLSFRLKSAWKSATSKKGNSKDKRLCQTAA